MCESAGAVTLPGGDGSHASPTRVRPWTSRSRSSSLGLVYHTCRLVEPASSLRNACLETRLTGRHRGLGEEIRPVLALEEWERFELDVIGSAFRAGRAFGEARTSGGMRFS
ncbi:MAG: hypothetical protein H0U97_20715 [Gammaproteobacteria bacterium]|nr:hypothetical protein [Gammaproteobacteria bacterium]